MLQNKVNFPNYVDFWVNFINKINWKKLKICGCFSDQEVIKYSLQIIFMTH